MHRACQIGFIIISDAMSIKIPVHGHSYVLQQENCSYPFVFTAIFSR